jgi:hypothetical protein
MSYFIEEMMHHKQAEIERRALVYSRLFGGGRPTRTARTPPGERGSLMTWLPLRKSKPTSASCARAAGMARCA